MLNGRPVFPGTSTMNQIERILEITGSPNSSDVEALSSPYAATMLSTLPPIASKSIHEVFLTASPDAKDFLTSTLRFNPSMRPNAEQALQHIYVADFHNVEEEQVKAMRLK